MKKEAKYKVTVRMRSGFTFTNGFNSLERALQIYKIFSASLTTNKMKGAIELNSDVSKDSDEDRWAIRTSEIELVTFKTYE